MLSVPQNVLDAIRSASTRTGVDEDLLLGIAYIESSFDPAVMNGKRLSPTQVSGLFQITGATWKSLRLDGTKKTTDLMEQAYTAALLIKKLDEKYKGDKNLIAIAYNAGEGVSDQLKGKEITYEAIKNAVQKFSGQKGFGPEKVKEVFQYPQKLSKAMGEATTITGSIPVNALSQTDKKNSVTSIPITIAQKFNENYTVLENFTLEASGTALLELNQSILSTANLRKTSLVKKIRAGKARERVLESRGVM